MPASPTTKVSSKALRYVLTGALAGALLAGTASAGNPARDAARSAREAQSALAKGRPDQAVGFAEAAVAAAPQDAAMRALLGQAYLRAGRFESAAVTFDEARQLGDAGSRTALSLALAQIGRGHAGNAVAVLDGARDTISADDLGLAYALAGESARGVAILTDAIRSGEATPKQRQNLAYSYALDGRWREARIMMMQDVPADQIDGRISDWASRAKPEDFQQRVAVMLGAPVVADSGRPERLALVAPAAAEQVAAVEAPVAEPVVAAAPQAELPAVTDNNVPPSLAFSAQVEPAPVAEVAEAPATPVTESFTTAFAAAASISQPLVQAVPAAAKRPVRVATARPATGGSHLVQLGSFSSEANARRAWRVFTARNGGLRNYRVTITPVVVRGKNFWRVAAAGFNAASANGMCGAVKARGGACFAYAVGRPMKTDAPRYASAGQLARRR